MGWWKVPPRTTSLGKDYLSFPFMVPFTHNRLCTDYYKYDPRRRLGVSAYYNCGFKVYKSDFLEGGWVGHALTN